MKLTAKQQKRVKSIAEAYDLRLVLLFGSQSDGRTHTESDVDIAYLAAKPLSFEEEFRLNYEFTVLFGTDRVDTVDLRTASPLLGYAVFQHPIVLYQKDPLVFPVYQTYAFKKYIEAKPLYEEKFRRLGAAKIAAQPYNS